MEHFKQYVYGRQFVVLTDHQPLKYLLTADAPAPRLARLQNRLKLYDYIIDYRRGPVHGNADALSRMVSEDGVGISAANDLDDEEQEIMINMVRINDMSESLNQKNDVDMLWFINKKKKKKRQV